VQPDVLADVLSVWRQNATSSLRPLPDECGSLLVREMRVVGRGVCRERGSPPKSYGLFSLTDNRRFLQRVPRLSVLQDLRPCDRQKALSSVYQEVCFMRRHEQWEINWKSGSYGLARDLGLSFQCGLAAPMKSFEDWALLRSNADSTLTSRRRGRRSNSPTWTARTCH